MDIRSDANEQSRAGSKIRCVDAFVGKLS